jgi:hypothetical protein
MIPAILWTYNPEQGALISQFNEQISVYHCIDEFTAGTKRRKRHIINQLEIELLSKTDLVFANSILTYENKRQYNTDIYRIPSGADIAHFYKVNAPDLLIHPDVATISPPPTYLFILMLPQYHDQY